MKSGLTCLSFGGLVPIVCLVLLLTGVHAVASAAEPGAAALPASVAESMSALDLARLPVPDGAKPMFVGPQVAMHTADAPVADTVEACRELLVARGWQPYGQAGNTSFFKQNAIRLTVAIAAAPGQGGKTSISYTAEQLSADLPAPSDTVRLQYADSTKQLSFDTKEDEAAIVAFYRDSLTSGGWKSTTGAPLQIDWKKVLIFRNDARDMLTLELYHVKAENLLRVTLKHQSAAEVDAVDARLDAQMAAKTAKQVPQEKVPVSVPAGARLTAQTPTRVEFTVSAAQTAAVAQSLRKTFRDGGWTEKETVADGTIGEITWTKANHELSLSYVNTGFTPAEFTIRAKGVELEVAGR